MEKKYLLGVDIGTYESKGVIAAVDGTVVATGVRPHELAIPRQGWAEHDAETVWWGDFCAIVWELLRESGLDPAELAAVGCSAIGPDMLPLDRMGRPLRAAVLYGIDTRATAEIATLERQLGRETIFERCGNYLSTQSVGPKILWLKNQEPEHYRQAYKLVTGTSFLVARLTGNYVVDHYTAAAGFTPLYDTRSRGWAADLCRPIVAPDKLPEVAWTTDIAGTVTGTAAEQTGLAPGTPVIVGTCDAAAEAVSTGVVAPGQMMLMYGSTVFLVEVLDRPLIDARLWAAPYLFPGTYCLTAGMATAGSLTRWFRDNLARELVAAEEAAGINAYAELARQAAAIPPGAEGLVVLPYFSGERTPINDPQARGLIFGLTLAHRREHLYRAVLEGIGHGIRHHLDILAEIGAAPETITAVGGGTKNPLWLQIVSDICGAAQQVPAVTVGAAYGDAFLAGLGAGVFSSYAAIADWVKRGPAVRPNPQYAARYRQYHELYLNLYCQNQAAMHAIQSLL
ncbi:xylulokinase [Hydrogenispora ethanolica]|uniref:Xylulokinase n=1 Tax=Hydrogenispora ethanolica TaxID=1082276 RepID=A0A4R1R8L6_HYDET|nr:FGGY-family carbohydrate kinase [Hydrogenispora ethanolica]TCL61958.1 xylulokinase [Hydrogenispora ethanolica]